jgi:acyl-CoA synthetase (AMP-forming)/AMP-acid ligase II
VTQALLPRLLERPAARAARMPDGDIAYGELEHASAALAARLLAPETRPHASRPLALWAAPSVATVIALAAGLRAGLPLLPINPKSGAMELDHVLADAAPSALLAERGATLPPALRELPRLDPRDGATASGAREAPPEPPGEAAALVMYTSGTTGPPKGVVQTRAALIANLDALADVWGLRGDVEIVHALPLFHVHGLVLGTIGPLRLGACVRHLGGFDVDSFAAALQESSVLFGVPTMYHRLLAAAEQDPGLRAALARARLLVSGSAALGVDVHAGIERLTGRRVVERYGMTETLIISSTLPGERARPGYVGGPLPGVEVSVRDEDGVEMAHDDEAIGGVWVRGPSVFGSYVNEARARAADSFERGWFATGDLAAVTGEGELRLVGRRSTDLIKSGGYRIAAAEIEAALLEHPAVSEAAVRGVPDGELGERVAAWVVIAHGQRVGDNELTDHVANALTQHKRPREIRRVQALPRNELGKVQKQQLEL